SLAKDLARRIRMMIFMEEKILFPNALKKLTNRDWVQIRNGESAIGYAWVKPGAEWDAGLVSNMPDQQDQNRVPAETHSTSASKTNEENLAMDNRTPLAPETPIPLSVGSLPLSYLDGILKMLPFDISFVDANDKVMYYSDSPHRVFPRSPAIIGRAVQNCHPPKSVATVEKILEAFRKKEKDKAEFWIEMNGKFIYIAYKPLYDASGTYLGTLEMSMDATELRALRGQRRLLDW
ncbi:MAG TPA: PAS domain-containing protein, partial [Spirochaetales bacterium]|nr:PAS domain-containing protein [Spirochaetales bacterium]